MNKLRKDIVNVSEWFQYKLERLKVGRIIECPVCDTSFELKVHKINRRVVRFMQRLYEVSNGEPYEFFTNAKILGTDVGSKAEKNSTEAYYLVHWGLLVKNGVGKYALSDRGVDFVEGKRTVRQCCSTLRGETKEFFGEQVGINDIVGRDKVRISYSR